MKFIKVFLIGLFALSNILFGQQKFTITFNVNASGLNDTDAVYMSGNGEQLGNWQPDKVLLTKLNDSSWSLTKEFPEGTLLEFKFTLGTWEREALNDDGSIPGNYKVIVNRDTTLNFTINNWGKAGSSKRTGQITGIVEYYREFKSNHIRSRDIIVWLPENYFNSELRYPVLYMQDGQNIFDPATSSFGYDWQVDETADSLIKQRIIDPIIVVGIYNTPDRSSEYTPNDTSKAYMKFIVDELKPFIDKNYRTMPDRNNTSVAGSSAGALISFMLLWEYPNVFSKAACLSPAFKIGRIDYVSTVVNSNINSEDVLIYIDNGGVELESLLQPGVDEMILALETKGFVKEKNLFWKKFENAYHNEQAWAKRFYIPLKLFYGRKEH
ncbi:MAG: histidine kinase [Ignavibacteriales bacterium]|nr:MAG: histidine kinase [Ignavibacteriales bacterium]